MTFSHPSSRMKFQHPHSITSSLALLAFKPIDLAQLYGCDFHDCIGLHFRLVLFRAVFFMILFHLLSI